MAYINPLEILDLTQIPISDIDSTMIKKAKRKLFAEIDLSDDGHFDYKGVKLSRSDCEKAVEELENSSQIDFHLSLSENKSLNNYLVTGDESFFSNYRMESIYQMPEFINFVSPYFAERIDKSLLNAFKSGDENKLQAVLRTSGLLSPRDYNTAYKSLSAEIQDRIQSLKGTTNEIREEETEYDDFDIGEILPEIEQKFPANMLNLLPSYFQSQINLIGKELNYLQLAIDGYFENTGLCVKILDHLFKLRLESATMGTYKNNYKILSGRLQREQEIAINKPVLQKWAKELVDLRQMHAHLENNKISPEVSYNTVSTQINFTELNSLGSFADDIKTQTAYALRHISVVCWNKYQDIKNSLLFIDRALSIHGLPQDVVDNLEDDQENLFQIKKDNEHLLTCHFCKEKPPVEKAARKVKIYKEYNRTWSGNRRRVQYHTLEISVPQCADCAVIAGNSVNNTLKIVAATLAVGVLTGYLMEGSHFILGGILGILVGYVASRIYKRSFYKSHGLKIVDESDYILIKEKLKQGWQLNEPTA